ncbi:hypothetical protein RCL1_001337 [Eukaryota sp. TZLM3-RCL]
MNKLIEIKHCRIEFSSQLSKMSEKPRKPRRLCSLSAFIPIIGRSGSIQSSKFGGLPFLPPGLSIPSTDEYLLPLMLQLNVSTLPAKAKEYLGLERGFIQLFYSCSELEIEGEGWEHDNNQASVVRYFDVEDDSVHVPPDQVSEEKYRERFITSWRPLTDSISDYENHGPDFFAYGDPITGDKLLGAPSWVQSPDYSHCKRCSAKKRHVFQIDSEQNVEHMFGDMGTAYLQQCPRCKTEFSFGWQCS